MDLLFIAYPCFPKILSCHINLITNSAIFHNQTIFTDICYGTFYKRNQISRLLP